MDGAVGEWGAGVVVAVVGGFVIVLGAIVDVGVEAVYESVTGAVSCTEAGVIASFALNRYILFALKSVVWNGYGWVLFGRKVVGWSLGASGGNNCLCGGK